MPHPVPTSHHLHHLPVTITDIFKFIRLVIDSNKIKGNRKQTPDYVYIR